MKRAAGRATDLEDLKYLKRLRADKYRKNLDSGQYLFESWFAIPHIDWMERCKQIPTLGRRILKTNLQEKDILEKYVRSSGKGGQKFNKASTCIYLKHFPNQIEIKCQQERSQSVNCFLARRILGDKIEAMINRKENQEQQRIDKIRRHKRKRSKRVKFPSRILWL